MYIPAHFKETSTEVMHGLINAHPLGTLIVSTNNGLEANHIPFFLSEDILLDNCLLENKGEFGTLRGHVARANQVWLNFKSDAEVLVVFNGEQSYVTPSWYPAKNETGKVVPTWNYTAVHAYGKLQVKHEISWIRRHLEELTRTNEHAIHGDWQVSDAPVDYIERLMEMIVGIEIPISRLEGKWKVSQNQPAQNRDGVIQGLREKSGNQCPMAYLVEAYKLK